MSIRTLIERALQEARSEFEVVITNKIAAVMGDIENARAAAAPKAAAAAASPAPRRGRRGRRRGAVAAAPRAAAPAKRGRRAKGPYASKDHLNDLRAKILGVFTPGATLKRSD